MPDRQWDALLVCAAIYLLMAVGRVHQLFPVVNLVRPAILAGAGAILLYLVDKRTDRRLELVLTTPMQWLLAFLGWMTLSMMAALVITNSFELVINNFMKTVIMSFVIAGAVRGVRDVERMALAYFASATIYATVVLLMFSASGYGSDAGRLGDLFYYDANDFATFVVTAMPLGLYFLHGSRTKIGQMLAMGSLGILTLAFVKSGSRGGFIAALAVGVLVIGKYSAVKVRWRLAAVALVTVVIVGTATTQYWERMGTILSESDYNRTNDSGRFKIWARGMGYMAMFPVLGVGPANFPTAEGTLSELAARQRFGLRWNAAHNSYVQVGAESGFIGLGIFVMMLAATFAAVRSVRRRAKAKADKRMRELAQALTGALLGFAVGAFFLSLAYSEMLYALIAMIVGLHKVARLTLPHTRPQS
jgi:O-antigen ligase